MARVRYSQTTFTAGRLPPYIDSRNDSEIFKAGLSVCENFLTVPQGPLISRYGFEFVATLTDARERLVTFKFDGSDEQYVFVFGNYQIKIFYDKTLVFILTGTPWAIDELTQIKFVNKEDSLLVVHPSYDIRQINRVGANDNWSISTYAYSHKPFFRFPGTELDASDDTITFNADNNSTSGTITASEAIFTDDWDGKEIRFGTTRGFGIVVINDGTLNSTASTTADYNIVEDLTGSGADGDWMEQATSPHRGYYGAIAFHDDRLYLGGSTSLPQTIFASTVGDYFDFDDTDTLDDMAFSRTLSTGLVEQIKDMKSYDNFMVFTDSAEYEVHANGNVITPATIQTNKRTNYGIGNVGVLEVDSELLYLTRNGRELRSLVFADDTQAFVAKNYTIIHDDAVSNPLDIAYLRNYRGKQANHIFVVNSDGDMAVCGLNAEKNIIGWSDVTTPSGEFKSVTVCATDHDNNGNKLDTLYAVVERNHGVFLEALTEKEILLDHWYSDSGSSSTIWGPFESVESGDVYQVVTGELGNPTVHGEVTAVSGYVTLNSATTDVQIGFEYNRTATTMPVSLIAYSQNWRGERIRLIKAEANVYQTRAITIGGKPISFRNLGDSLLDQGVTAFTGTVRNHIGGYGRDKTLSLVVNEPVDATIRGITLEIGLG